MQLAKPRTNSPRSHQRAGKPQLLRGDARNLKSGLDFLRALVIKSVDSILRYNVLSRIWASIACRLLGIPIVSYFDDFASLVRRAYLKKRYAVSLCF